ncbi:bestrophin family protein [Rhodobacter lacus]|uniref:Bestrophin family protein n=1 Tax=Rhodobacter lacus TaxID=1641972 RepID=A0ABW5AEG1_9RHOB
MILRDKPSPLDLALAIKGSIMPAVARPVAVVAVVATALTGLGLRFQVLPVLDPVSVTVFGLALSLFLGFRNNAAYERWWEARQLWGGLLADLRMLAREAEIFIPDSALRREVLRDALAFAHLHRARLRGRPADPDCQRRAPDLMAAPNPACAALDRLTAKLAEAHRAGMIDGFGARALTQRLGSISLAQAGNERIALTPLPFVYSLLIYRTIYIFCLILPVALFAAAGWLTPVIVVIVAYVFLGLAEVSEQMSQPFGDAPNALPLDALCRAMEISLAAHLGEDAPPPLAPIDYQLS